MINYLIQQLTEHSVIFIFALLIVGITIKAIADNITKIKISKIEYDNVKLVLNHEIKEEEYNLLNTFILKELDEYIIKNIAYKEITYINSSMEENILRELTEQVCSKISPLFVTKLSMIYDTRGQKIIRLISNACHLCVTNYVINYNTSGPQAE